MKSFFWQFFALTQEIFANVVNLPFYGLGFLQFLFPLFAKGQREEKNLNGRKWKTCELLLMCIFQSHILNLTNFVITMF